MTEIDNIALEAVGHYGIAHQLVKTAEELSELSQMVSKAAGLYMGGKPVSNDIIMHIAEETADVEIMLWQVRKIFIFSKEVEDWKKFKIDRLKKAIQDELNGGDTDVCV